MLLQKIKQFKKENYERFFEVEGANFLFATIYAKVYKNIGIIIINDNGNVSFNLSKPGVAGTKRMGHRFLNNKKSFEKYSGDFLSFLNSGVKYFNKIINKKEASEKDAGNFFKKIIEFYSFYQKTEFFYTDYAYLKIKKSNNYLLQKNLIHLEQLKTLGRKFLIKIFNGKSSFLNKLLKKISKSNKLSEDKLQLYHFIELAGIKNNILNDKKLNLRKKNYILDYSKKRELFLKNNKLKDISRKYNININNIIKGVIANKGKIKGFARVIDANFKNFDNLSKIIRRMKKGEILIAETTSPDLILACQKASAIITNQGGLGSHAAIISRELKIPCIVGTQNSTKLIRTGDLLHIDANKGIVQILTNK